MIPSDIVTTLFTYERVTCADRAVGSPMGRATPEGTNLSVVPSDKHSFIARPPRRGAEGFWANIRSWLRYFLGTPDRRL